MSMILSISIALLSRFLDRRVDLDLVATGITMIDIRGIPCGKRSLEPIQVSWRGFLSGRTVRVPSLLQIVGRGLTESSSA